MRRLQRVIITVTHRGSLPQAIWMANMDGTIYAFEFILFIEQLNMSKLELKGMKRIAYFLRILQNTKRGISLIKKEQKQYLLKVMDYHTKVVTRQTKEGTYKVG